LQLSRFPRIRLAHLPTPLEPMPRLTAALGGPELWIKRDDCTGLSTGGNKTRKLEYLMAEALAMGADMGADPRRHPVEPRAPDGGGTAGPGLPSDPGGSDGL